MSSLGLSPWELFQNPESFLNPQHFYGLYRGRVMDRDDPEQRGRLRVLVTDVHPEEIPKDGLPWAEACFLDGGRREYGDFHVPYNEGDTVLVMFLHGDWHYPVWVGTFYGSPDGGLSEVPAEARASYPYRRLIKTPRGNKIEISDEDGFEEIKLTDYRGSYIRMNTGSDALDIVWIGDVNWRVDGDINMEASGNIVTTAGEHNVAIENNITEYPREVHVRGKTRTVEDP